MLLFINGRWFEPGLGPTKCRTWSGSILFITKYVLNFYFIIFFFFLSCSPLFHCACKLYMLKRWGGLFPGSECCVVMQISMRIQIWVLVSMIDFMPGKGEHETCIFCHFYGKSGATSWHYVHVNVMSHINIYKFKMVEQRLCSWYKSACFFLKKAFGRNIEIELIYHMCSHNYVVFIMLINVKMPTIVGILTFMSRIKFCAQLSWAWKKFYNLGAWSECVKADMKKCSLGSIHPLNRKTWSLGVRHSSHLLPAPGSSRKINSGSCLDSHTTLVLFWAFSLWSF